MTADYELPGPSFGGQCPVCSVWTEAREGGICHTVECPARGLRPDSAEAIGLASVTSFRPMLSSGSPRRSLMSGEDAVAAHEHRTLLDLRAAMGEVIDYDIEHERQA